MPARKEIRAVLGGASERRLKRDLALINLAIDSWLRANDLVKVKICDVFNAGIVASAAFGRVKLSGTDPLCS